LSTPLVSLVSLGVIALPLDGPAAAPESLLSVPVRVAGDHSAGRREAASARLPAPVVRSASSPRRPIGRAAPGQQDAPVLVLATASNSKLERCRYLHHRIEHFTRLRRSGGSGAQMERWRRSRQRLEEEYRRKRCYRFGRKLKERR
jgi:hypothetical protein